MNFYLNPGSIERRETKHVNAMKFKAETERNTNYEIREKKGGRGMFVPLTWININAKGIPFLQKLFKNSYRRP